MEEKARSIFGSSVNITSEGKRHLGAVIGSNSFKKKYCEEKVDSWMKELSTLCEIAESQPQSAYAAYTKGYRSKFTYFLRTINQFKDYVTPVDNLLSEKFIPKLFGADTSLGQLRDVITLKQSDGGLGINILAEEAEEQHNSSKKITLLHVESIINQEHVIRKQSTDEKTVEDLKHENSLQKLETRKLKMARIDANLTDNIGTFVKRARDKGASSWLNALPIEDQDFVLNKEEFRDALRLRYNIPLDNLQSTCPCGDRFSVSHALSCKKGGFISQRHDTVRDVLAVLLNKVCKDVETEPHLIPITTEIMDLRTANVNDDSRLDIKARGFWRRGQTAFFDVRITHVNSESQKECDTSKIFKTHEQAKKREYLQRVIDVENGSFTPLVFGTNGGMGMECDRFLSNLANKLSAKSEDKYAAIMSWMRTRLSFEILRSTLVCVRGSRVPFKRNNNDIDDFALMNVHSHLNV